MQLTQAVTTLLRMNTGVRLMDYTLMFKTHSWLHSFFQQELTYHCRWVHVDATRGIVDGADQVEGATAACRSPLRYVVVFAGAGAKDVTRR